MKTLRLDARRTLVVPLVLLLAVITAQSQDKPNYDSLIARGQAIAAADPAATELRNQQPDDLARRGFDIGMGVAETDTMPGPGKQRIHDSLRLSEQAGFDVAVSYSLARNRKKLTDLAPRGAELAQLDPLAQELRNQQSNGDARLGFDIGMAAAEKDTLPGPGKQKMHDSLYPCEQPGFASAVSFSLDRNRNAELARIGANIARLSPNVGLARNVDGDVFRRLGFDIAAGLYGDPKLGSKGSTKMGPGALAIRDALSPAAQKGFNQGANFLLPGGFGFSESAKNSDPNDPRLQITEAADGTLRLIEILEDLKRREGTIDEKTIDPNEAKDYFLYAVRPNGDLLWYMHRVSPRRQIDTVTHLLDGPKRVGNGWESFSVVLPAGLSGMYALTQEGKLLWYRHDGFRDGSMNWVTAREVGRCWGDFKQIVPMGDGIIYTITQNGNLEWRRHAGYLDGRGLDSPGAWEGPRILGTGWGDFKFVFAGGEGVIYAVTNSGDLRWYRHKNFMSGVRDWEGPKIVGNGWESFKMVFSPGEGMIYAIKPTGELVWYKHEGYKDGSKRWQAPVQIAADWSDFIFVFPRLKGTYFPPVPR